MIVRALREIPYLLPVYLLALCLSPNITEQGIQTSFVTCILLLAPLIGLIRSGNKFALRGLLQKPSFYFGILIFLLIIWLNLGLPAFYTLFVSSILVISAVARGKGWMSEAIAVSLFFFLCYMDINSYGWEQILGLRSALFILATSAYPLLYLSRDGRKYGYILFPLAFGFLTLIFETYQYFWPLIIVIIPRAILERRFKLALLTDIITGILLTVYLVYYLLFATHLWQALTGGL